MATKKTLDSLVEAANMIEKKKGSIYNDIKESVSSSKEVCSDEGECSRFLSRMNHNVLERNRRAQMRYNFNSLQEILPKLSGQKKVSNVCILKAATNEIKKLLDDDTTFRQEKEKLQKYNITLISKLQKLQDSSEAPGKRKNSVKGTEKEHTYSNKGSCISSQKPRNMKRITSGKMKTGMNSDGDEESDSTCLPESDDLQIDIED